MGITDDDQICEELVWELDARYGIDSLQCTKDRHVLERTRPY